MKPQSQNRVLAMKNKFENLSNDDEFLLNKSRKGNKSQLFKQENNSNTPKLNDSDDKQNISAIFQSESHSESEKKTLLKCDSDISSDENNLTPNSSYLYSQKIDCDTKKLNLSRQSSDPGKKLHRSHAFRCDKSQKIVSTSPKRHGSCNGRSETSDYKVKSIEKPKLSKDKLKKLGNLLEDRMKKENFVINNSIPDEEVPKHILDQYAKVLKPKRNAEPLNEQRQDGLTDSGVSSETENLEECPEKPSRLKLLKAQFETVEKTDSIVKKSNLELMNNDDLCCSSETMRLERINPNIDLTDTLKKALKQPLPPGPPPKKPPRTFQSPPPPENIKKQKNAKEMLEKLEQVFLKRDPKPETNIYDVAETDLSTKKKEIHYLCTEILDITQRTLLPNTQKSTEAITNCFNNLNCGIIPTKSTTSLPYTRLSTHLIPTRNSITNLCCSCSMDSLDCNEENKQKFSTFFMSKPDENLCKRCNSNLAKTGRFQCHLNCKCRLQKSEFFVQNEHIYDEPHIDISEGNTSAKEVLRKSLPLPDDTRHLQVATSSFIYGTIKGVKTDAVLSRSLEDLRRKRRDNSEEKTYDIPCDPSRSPSPEFGAVIPKNQFESIRMSFENGPLQKEIAKPSFVKTRSDSKINNSNVVSEEFRNAKKNMEKKFSTEIRKPRLYEKSKIQTSPNHLTAPRKKNYQLDVDKENLNRLMNEIYETVSAACRMEDQLRPTKFPIDPSDGTSSEDSVKLTRSLTEKRKTYVRRVSSRAGYLDKNVKTRRYRNQTSVCSYKSDNVNLEHNPYSTFRTWKSFRHSQNNINQSKMDESNFSDSKFNLTDSTGNLMSLKDEFGDSEDLCLDNLSLDEKAGCLDLELPFEAHERALFDLCLLVGLNYMTGQSYVKSVFPSQVKVPQHVGNLVFPEHLKLDDPDIKPEFDLQAARSQCYSLVLTNEKGERNYGYCRRVLPEGTSCCLPLCYCIISRYRAPGFYYKVLQEIESHHGNSDIEINTILHQLIDCEFPNPGEELQIKYTQNTNIRHSQNFDLKKCQTLPNTFENVKNSPEKNDIPEFYDIENNNNTNLNKVELNLSKVRVLKRPIEPRIDEDSLSVLLDSLGPSLTVKIFGSLLLERKVVFMSDNLSQLSSCIEALQSILYPFVWQQPLISTIPSELRKDILEAPLPILAGLLKRTDECTEFVHNIQFQEGILVDLTNSHTKLIHNQGDESSILPSMYYKTLKSTLQLESCKHSLKDKDTEKTRNVLISETFLRFFVDVFADFWSYFTFAELKDGDLGKNGVVFDKEKFIKEANPKQIDFLEWFAETAMFSHFATNMAACFAYRQKDKKIDFAQTMDAVVDAPLPNYYELFNDRIINKINSNKKTLKPENKCDSKNNYKSAMNKKIKVLKNKLKDLVN